MNWMALTFFLRDGKENFGSLSSFSSVVLSLLSPSTSESLLIVPSLMTTGLKVSLMAHPALLLLFFSSGFSSAIFVSLAMMAGSKVF